jgi:hypothetical protein
MLESQRSISDNPILDRPLCAQCGKRMMLARIAPETPGVERRTYECECGNSESMLVKYR